MNFPSRNEKAFTLVEIILALAIFGILVTVAMLGLDYFQTSKRLDAALREIASDIREAQSRAMAEQMYYGIHFIEAENIYFIHRDTTTTTLFDTDPIPWGPHGETTAALTEGIVFERAGPNNTDPITFNDNWYDALVFEPSGSPKRPGSVYLQNERNKERYLTVGMETGRVRLY
ncbi:MAG: type II secretion system protein [Actinomycetota bacterium]|nr:type II secretion system protein [Actinomycetota bacterium]